MDESIRRQLLVEKVADVVCNYYGVDVNDVFSTTRKRPIALARESIIYILHCDFCLSLSFLSRTFERTPRWICDICATKRLHIELYEDSFEEHEILLKLIKNR